MKAAIATLAAVLVLMLAPALFADTILLKDGRTLHGTVTEDGDDYVIAMKYGTMRVHVAEVVSREPDAAVADGKGAAPAGNGSATQPTTNPDAPELTERQQNLLMQLSDAEANIQAINKALRLTGYKVGKAYDQIDSKFGGKVSMDLNGGGPVRWDAFYGHTAKEYVCSGWGDRRPQQFGFI